MRKTIAFAALVIILGVVGSARAQHAVSFGGVDATSIKCTPIDTSKSVAPFARPAMPSSSGIGGFFHRLSLPRWLGGSKSSTAPAAPANKLPSLSHKQAFKPTTPTTP